MKNAWVLKPATVKLDLQALSTALFNAEVEKYMELPNHEENLNEWLEALRRVIENEVIGLRNKNRSYARHCPVKEQREAICEALEDQSKNWLNVVRAHQYHRELVAKGVEQHKQTLQTASDGGKTISERLDEAVARLDITHDELARRMSIGKTTYFAVKGGGGKRSTRLKVDQYLQKLNESEP